MAVSVLAPAANLKQPNLIGICFREAKYEFLKNLRLPMFSVSVVVLPVMFYVLFGLIMGRQAIAGLRVSAYLVAAYGTFGVIGASLFGTAAGLAVERGFGWLEVKKASAMPPFAYFFAKVVMSMIFSTVDVLLLLLLGTIFGGVHIPVVVGLQLLLTLVAGSLPFCAMGLALGYFAGPTAAPALINIFYLPMSFCSGLWIPLMFLPRVVQRIAVFLPPYHLAQLALPLVGAGTGTAANRHWEALIGFSLICLGIAWIGHRRDQRGRA
jgi:ABC-2 type transport system permease protein